MGKDSGSLLGHSPTWANICSVQLLSEGPDQQHASFSLRIDTWKRKISFSGSRKLCQELTSCKSCTLSATMFSSS
jgi:hypothetical protein